jgi:hypothetical protein
MKRLFMLAEKLEKTKSSLSSFGIAPMHHVLCEGSTFPPEKRTSMAMSVGSLTALLNYLTSNEKYRGKWKQATINAFSIY